MLCIQAVLLILVHSVFCHFVSHKIDTNDLGKVIYANIVFRHGDRTPVNPYPKDPYRNESEWPVPFGQLTPIGMHQHLMLGRWFRKRYNHLLPDHYSVHDIYVRSTDVDRTLMSAEANLAGLYPPKGNQIWDDMKWMPIPVHTSPQKEDNLLAGKKFCPRYNDELQKVLNSSTFVKINQNHAQLYEYLYKYSGTKINTLTDLEYLYNNLYIETLYNKTLPAWTKGVFPDKMKPLADLSFTLQAHNNILQKLKVGPLLEEMISHMIMKSRDLLSPNRKLWMYSGHDDTIANLMMALKIFEPHCPPYASALLMELRKNASNHYVVTVSYKNTTGEPTVLTIPGCQKACPLDDFIKLTEDVIPKDWKKECLLECYKDELETDFSLLIVILISAALIMCMLIILIAAFVYSYFKRNYTQYYFRLSSDLF
ncbi:prostatic acid phosphatase-like [Chelonus insularis]|uniref:prostatic acid phosphatase-like n=1 Tax=Chelonus insularis TaxID=460826 RepID=UPI001589B075|nr:prostatic acid phosphatase-like [Chelonus insularis]